MLLRLGRDKIQRSGIFQQIWVESAVSVNGFAKSGGLAGELNGLHDPRREAESFQARHGDGIEYPSPLSAPTAVRISDNLRSGIGLKSYS